MRLPVIIASLLAVCFASCTTSAPHGGANAGGRPGPAYRGSADFERLKALAGRWQGTSSTMLGPITAEYRVTGGGSVVEERLFSGTPMEMLTTYHENGGRLTLTHYCALRNQPRMRLARSTADSLVFEFAPSPGIDPRRDEHMHGVILHFTGSNDLTATWSLWKGGKQTGSHALQFKRR